MRSWLSYLFVIGARGNGKSDVVIELCICSMVVVNQLSALKQTTFILIILSNSILFGCHPA